jgi:phosphoadenosine phosphosulfate reductase
VGLNLVAASIAAEPFQANRQRTVNGAEPMGSRIEESRLRFALRSCVARGLKIYDAEELVEEAVEEFGSSLSVSWSGGKCSTAVLHMALKFKPDIKVFWCDTTVLWPEDYQYKEFLRKEWNLNLVETKPVKPFWQVVKEYGLPSIRRGPYRSYARIRGAPKNHTFQERRGKPACCWFCKDKPFIQAAKGLGVKATLTGLRCVESRARMFYAADYGQKHYAKKYRMWKIHPILFWTDGQLDNYLRENRIPMNPLYRKLESAAVGQIRSGCMVCTGFLYWQRQLAKLNPKMYRLVQRLLGQTLVSDYIALENEAADNCLPSSFEDWF